MAWLRCPTRRVACASATTPAHNRIGGANQGNVISGNTGYGVALGGAGGFTQILSNTIATNLIGLGYDGTTSLANSAGGVLLDSGSTENMIGGAERGATEPDLRQRRPRRGAHRHGDAG